MNFNRSISSCLDGIPFSFHEHIKRIEQIRVTSPATVVTQIETPDFSTFTYDSSIEDKYLLKCQEERRREAEIAKLQRHFQLLVEAQKTKITNNASPDSAPLMPPDLNHSTNQPGPTVSWNSIQNPTPLNIPRSVILPPAQKLGDEILIPSRPDPSDGKTEQATGKAKVNAIDLKDFEREQDPFENVSLKVINDIEELDKVFFASNQLSQSSLQTTPGMTFYHEVPGLSNAPVMNSTVAPNIQTTSTPQMSTLPQRSTHWWGIPQANLPGYFPPTQLGSGIAGSIPYPQHSLPLHQYQTSGPASGKNSTTDFNRLPMEISSKNFNTHQNNVSIAQNFYYNKYHTSIANNASSGTTETPELPLQSSLRHAKSTPDITAADAGSENLEPERRLPTGASGGGISGYLVQNLNLYGRYTPPLHHEKAINKTIHKNDDENPTTHSPHHHHHHHHQLPPLTNQNLNEDTRLRDKLRRFGFQKESVDKFVARFGGTDESKVNSEIMPRLRCIQDFISKGHDPKVIEECFLYVDSIPEQADRYLKVFGIFHIMGFQTESIHEALKISKLDEELTLNILTQN